MLKDFPIADLTAFSAPIEKLVALNVSKFEAAVEAQTAAAKELVELTNARVKALSEIKNVEGYTSFLKEQSELAQSSIAKAISDSKSSVEEAKAYGEEVKKIIEEGLKVSTAAVKKAVKKAA